MVFKRSLRVVAFVLLGFSFSLWAAKPPSAQVIKKATHLYSRLAFGERPGEVEKLAAQGEKGMAQWIEDQLHPERLSDPQLERKISPLKAPRMDSLTLLSTYKNLKKAAEEMGYKKADFENNEELKKKLRNQIGKEKLPEEIVREITAQKIIRAVESRRQFEEVMADFWYNHFNIDITKGEERWLVPVFEQEIRKHLFGKFGDLLKATAHSPAMLFYLDNHLSQSAEIYDELGTVRPGNRKNGGLNENYAREILELHTLGVEGGYTQTDVTELARLLTGWSIDSKENPVFKFRTHVHDRGEKTFLHQAFTSGHDQDEGERALEILIHHPATAKFIATKLCRALVTDEPDKNLVEQVAKRFRETNGDLRETYRAIISSPHFWESKNVLSKIKKPFFYVVSAIRAMGGEADLETKLPKLLATMGEDLYKCAPPTGYKDRTENWVNPGAMVSRLNFALELAANRIDGVIVQLPNLKTHHVSATEMVRELEAKLLPSGLGDNSERVILSEFNDENRIMADGEVRPLSLAKAAGMIIGSPEFQRR